MFRISNGIEDRGLFGGGRVFFGNFAEFDEFIEGAGLHAGGAHFVAVEELVGFFAMEVPEAAGEEGDAVVEIGAGGAGIVEEPGGDGADASEIPGEMDVFIDDGLFGFVARGEGGFDGLLAGDVEGSGFEGEGGVEGEEFMAAGVGGGTGFAFGGLGSGGFPGVGAVGGELGFGEGLFGFGFRHGEWGSFLA